MDASDTVQPSVESAIAWGRRLPTLGLEVYRSLMLEAARKPDAAMEAVFGSLTLDPGRSSIAVDGRRCLLARNVIDLFLETVTCLIRRIHDDITQIISQQTTVRPPVALPIKVRLLLADSTFDNGMVLRLANAVESYTPFQRTVVVDAIDLSNNIQVSAVGGKRLDRLLKDYPPLVNLTVEGCALNAGVKGRLHEATKENLRRFCVPPLLQCQEPPEGSTTAPGSATNDVPLDGFGKTETELSTPSSAPRTVDTTDVPVDGETATPEGDLLTKEDQEGSPAVVVADDIGIARQASDPAVCATPRESSASDRVESAMETPATLPRHPEDVLAAGATLVGAAAAAAAQPPELDEVSGSAPIEANEASSGSLLGLQPPAATNSSSSTLTDDGTQHPTNKLLFPTPPRVERKAAETAGARPLRFSRRVTGPSDEKDNTQCGTDDDVMAARSSSLVDSVADSTNTMLVAGKELRSDSLHDTAPVPPPGRGGAQLGSEDMSVNSVSMTMPPEMAGKLTSSLLKIFDQAAPMLKGAHEKCPPTPSHASHSRSPPSYSNTRGGGQVLRHLRAACALHSDTYRLVMHGSLSSGDPSPFDTDIVGRPTSNLHHLSMLLPFT